MAEQRFAAGGVVIKKEKNSFQILLIKDSYNRWTWPKGHIEKGETKEVAALREVTEETGLKDINIIEEIGKQEYFFTLKGAKIFKTVYIFLINSETTDTTVQLEEIQEAEWFSPEEALEKIEYEGSREILEKAINIVNRCQ
ncbi:MAG: NUDIX hydrolase [Candidatus Omnitrophota bacterium]